MNNDQFTFTISRTFNAPIKRVWDAWRTEAQFKQWFGPKGSTMPACKMDFRSGGQVSYNILFNDVSIWGKWHFTQIVPFEKIVALVMFTDATGEKAVRHPMNPNWPEKILSEVRFIDKNDKTEIIVNWQAFEADALSAKTFEEGAPSMQEGWGGTLEQLTDFLTNNP
jgi:uncharacterized protein YndB with AHSA1/START domain